MVTRNQIKDLTDDQLIQISEYIEPDFKGRFEVSKKYTERDQIYECEVKDETGNYESVIQFLFGEQYGDDPQFLIISFDGDFMESGLTDEMVVDISNLISN